jgi:hypothetical protein
MTGFQKIETKLTVKATGELQNDIEQELKVADPEKAKAIKILEEDEDTQRNDRKGSSGDDNQGSEPVC